ITVVFNFKSEFYLINVPTKALFNVKSYLHLINIPFEKIMPIRAHRSIENLSKCLNPNFQTLQRPIKVLESRLSIFSRHLYRHPATLAISATPTISVTPTIPITPTSDHSDYTGYFVNIRPITRRWISFVPS